MGAAGGSCFAAAPDPAAEDLAEDGAGDCQRDDSPAEALPETQGDDDGDGKVDVDEPAEGLLGRGFSQKTKRQINQKGKQKQAGEIEREGKVHQRGNPFCVSPDGVGTAIRYCT
jgi:hypothetical protein